MRLLFDANLSPRLVERLAELFPDSLHVFDTGLARFTSDESIWEYALEHGLMIVIADCNFLNLARSRGAPPKGGSPRKLQLQDGACGGVAAAACDSYRGVGIVGAWFPRNPNYELAAMAGLARGACRFSLQRDVWLLRRLNAEPKSQVCPSVRCVGGGQGDVCIKN